MAKVLKNFEFGAARSGGYDWDELLDGQIRQLEKGKDYDCKETTFGTLARNAAKRMGKTVRLSTLKEGEGKGAEAIGIVIQAVEGKAGEGNGKPAGKGKAPAKGGKGGKKAAAKQEPEEEPLEE